MITLNGKRVDVAANTPSISGKLINVKPTEYVGEYTATLVSHKGKAIGYAYNYNYLNGWDWHIRLV